MVATGVYLTNAAPVQAQTAPTRSGRRLHPRSICGADSRSVGVKRFGARDGAAGVREQIARSPVRQSDGSGLGLGSQQYGPCRAILAGVAQRF